VPGDPGCPNVGWQAFFNSTSFANGSHTLQVVGPATGAGATGCVSIWIRNALIGTATSTVFTEAENGSSGGGLNVFSVAGMTFAGLAAVYSSGITNSGLAVTTPSVAMSPAPDTTLPVIAAVSNSSLTNAGAPTSPAYTEALDGSYITPTLGLETMFINSGETRNPITWRNSSPSGYGAVVVQLDTSTTDAVGGVRLTLVGHARRVRGG
jgi:hypothetical protein